MPGPITVELNEADRELLGRLRNAGKTEKRLADRAKIILDSAAGRKASVIASELGLTPYVVSRWRRRYADEGVAGLYDRPRSGKPQQYGENDEKRILALLDKDPPQGYSRWNGPLLAKALGDINVQQVWRVLRHHNIHLERRRSWCISTDPQFASKAADIVGLYLAPPENAVVLCVDEKPCIQALERAQGYLKLPNGKAVTGFSHEYKRHGTTTLFAALETTTGLVKTGHYKRRRRREFLDFMNELVTDFGPDREMHVILDNLNTHKPKNDRWLARHPNVHFHYTPTHASWLNMVEVWFSILTSQSLRGASFCSPHQLRRHIDAFTKAHNEDAAPFEWRTESVKAKKLAKAYSNL
jgi:transposase